MTIIRGGANPSQAELIATQPSVLENAKTGDLAPAVLLSITLTTNKLEPDGVFEFVIPLTAGSDGIENLLNQIREAADAAFAMVDAVRQAKEDGDSYGG